MAWRRVFLGFCFAIAIATYGCGSTPARTASAPEEPANVSGRWTGSWAVGGGQSGFASVTIEQEGTRIHGVHTATAGPAFGGEFDGTVEGKSVSYVLKNSGNRADFTVNGNEMTGVLRNARYFLRRE